MGAPLTSQGNIMNRGQYHDTSIYMFQYIVDIGHLVILIQNAHSIYIILGLDNIFCLLYIKVFFQGGTVKCIVMENVH